LGRRSDTGKRKRNRAESVRLRLHDFSHPLKTKKSARLTYPLRKLQRNRKPARGYSEQRKNEAMGNRLDEITGLNEHVYGVGWEEGRLLKSWKKTSRCLDHKGMPTKEGASEIGAASVQQMFQCTDEGKGRLWERKRKTLLQKGDRFAERQQRGGMCNPWEGNPPARRTLQGRMLV